MTRKQAAARLVKVRREYTRALAEALALPESGNGFASRAEMRKGVAALYGPTLAALERKLEGR